MTDGVRPIGPVTRRDRRDAERRLAERRATSAKKTIDDAAACAIVVVSEVIDETPHPARPASPPAPGAAFAAQLIGQGGQRKGIRGGPPVMDAARSAYLGNEYSGDNDRRPPTGKGKRTEA